MKFSLLLSSLVLIYTSTTVAWGFSTPMRSLTRHNHSNKPTKTQPSLLSTASSNHVNGAIPQSSLDTDAVMKYVIAMGTQLSLFYATFSGLDWILAATQPTLQVPMAVNVVLFYFIALKSRVFNPLSNNRPKVKTLEAGNDEKKRIMPSWTPPGVVFPIVWLLIVGPLRATASALLYQTTQSYAHPAIMALLLHLSIGDTWNTINNVEKRYGTAVTGVLAVWLSKAHAAYRYYQVVPLAGKCLGVTLIWLTIAATLVTATWRLNPNPETGRPQFLYPVRGSVQTSFQWFQKTNTTTQTNDSVEEVKRTE